MNTNLIAKFAEFALTWYANQMSCNPYRTILVTVLVLAVIVAYLPKPKNQY